MERHTRHRGAVCYGLLNMWSAVAVSGTKTLNSGLQLRVFARIRWLNGCS
jgi:hypothetical protein